MHMMPQFVRQDGFDFVRGVFFEKRVGENDSPRAAQPG